MVKYSVYTVHCGGVVVQWLASWPNNQTNFWLEDTRLTVVQG